MSKYGNKRTKYDGITFDSQGEAARYAELWILEREGVISELALQPRYELLPKHRNAQGKAVRKVEYVGDFRYRENGKVIVEDVKAFDRRTRKFRTTQVFDLKKKWLEYKYPDIELRIVAA